MKSNDNRIKLNIIIIIIDNNIDIISNHVTLPNTIQYNTIQYNTIQYNAIHYNTIQSNMIHYNAIQCNRIQSSSIQSNAKQQSAIKEVYLPAFNISLFMPNASVTTTKSIFLNLLFDPSFPASASLSTAPSLTSILFSSTLMRLDEEREKLRRDNDKSNSKEINGSGNTVRHTADR